MMLAPRGLGRWTGLALAAVAGVGAALGQVPWSLWPLALLGYGVAIWTISQAEHRTRAFARGWMFGLTHFAVALHWITEPFKIDAARDGWMAPFALVFLAMGLALFWGLAALVATSGRDAGARAWRFALALVAAEALRGTILSGFPWAVPGHIWLNLAPEQLAALAGAGGLTLLTVGLALLPVAYAWRGALAALAVLACAWGFGAWRQSLPVPPPTGQIVRLVQPNAPQELKWDPDHMREFFNRQMDLTEAPSDLPLDLIVWPETSVPFLLNDAGMGLQVITDGARGVPVVVGIQRTEGQRFYNSFAVLGHNAGGEAEIRAVYDKHKLAPFGEYTPMGDVLADWLGIFAFSPADGNGYSMGPGPELMQLDGLPIFQPLICYEAVFPWILRAVDRPQWMLQITNDAWFGDLAGPYQHFALTRLRAIETGVPMLRAANTGVSAAIDARGRVVDSLGLNVMGHIDVALPAALPPTLYARLQIWPAILIWLFGAVLQFRRKMVID